MNKLYLVWLTLLGAQTLFTQINFNAHDGIPSYTGGFHYGSNLGNYPPWTNAEIGNIAAGNSTLNIEGIGVQNFRVSLQEEFVETWGYDIRKNDFEHWESIGMTDHLMMIGWPSDEHRDPNMYCSMSQSELFDNMYEPIWDGGANGTPVNENNYYANYVYKIVNEYKDFIKYYEVWNEPDFAYSQDAWLSPGQPGNWWDNNPNPCDYGIQAPIFHYVRLLRIAYEVIKSVDETAYICTGGIGNPAFLDAILRNTDNPIDGSATVEYPFGGGAWFDVLSYHSYPHFDGTMWEYPPTGGLFYYRHSDRGIEGMLGRKAAFQTVLEAYNYGSTYPEKLWVLSETMLPREQFNNYIGSPEAQRNYLLKALIEAQRNDILQVDLFSFSELESAVNNWNEYFYMGLFQNLAEIPVYQQELTDAGISFKTINSVLDGTVNYDENKTDQLNLPAGVKGAAFQKNNKHIFALWAETTLDQDETTSATYSFPVSFGFDGIEIKEWDYAETGFVSIQAPTNIALTATPIFIGEAEETGVAPNPNFSQNIAEGCVPFIVSFSDNSEGEPTSWNWTFEGGTINSSSIQNPAVTFFEPGVYGVTLTVSNIFGENSIIVSDAVVAEDVPVPSFSYSDTELVFTTTNLSENAISYQWDFGDENMSNEESPVHTYESSGTYLVELTATNDCGSETFSQEVIIQTLSVENIEGLSEVKVFPNPNSGQFTLKFESTVSSEMGMIMNDILGREIYQNIEQFNAGTFQKQFDFSSLQSGLYLIQIELDGQIGFLKILIE